MIKRSGHFKVANVFGAPVEIQWMLPVIAFLLCFVENSFARKYGFMGLALTFLVIVHELGHAAMARYFGVRVMRIQITGTGGLCYIEHPKQIRHSALIWSAGLMVQASVLLLACAYVALYGMPQGVEGFALIFAFIPLNCLILVINLIPHRTKSGHSSDGKVLWELFRHVHLGGPQPAVVSMSHGDSPVFPPEQRLLSLPQFRTASFKQGIEILNDPSTTMAFVLDVLSRHLGLNEEEATQRMLEIHHQGGVLIALPTKEEARKVADAITADARDGGHSLICRYADIEEGSV
jgi:ATP-dependent Clp protease adapter protein ClpS